MTAPNKNALWGRTLVEELAAGGLEAVCIAPGSRSTPLTVAFAAHPEIRVYSHLDERAAAFFALGRSRRTGEATALVCTSGTAAANFHPAVVEADRGRVPLVVLTADRPAELRDSGANQTIDQRDLYGTAVRWAVDLPEPKVDERTVRSLRTTAARALATATGTPAGPVHLNCPFSKPLEPVEIRDDVPEAFAETLAGRGREGAFVETRNGRQSADEGTVRSIVETLETARRPLVVAGPSDPATPFETRTWRERLASLARSTATPVLADPLSGLRFGPHVAETPIYSGYDSYVDRALPDPDLVIRVGASPTSKSLRHYLRDAEARQVLVDPAGDWREATFTATDLVGADPASLFDAIGTEIDCDRARERVERSWNERFRTAEAAVDEVLGDALERDAVVTKPFEGAVLATVFADAPSPSTVFVSNSMPVRDADRFGRARSDELTVLGNRGASGIDGITSTALGAGSATDEPLTLVTGDLAFYHDLTGLLAIDRCDVDVTAVVIQNDGGGIFHMLPIEAYDPPFTDQFKTPHGLDFSAVGELYDLEYDTVSLAEFPATYRRATEQDGSHVIEVEVEAAASHRRREELATQIRERIDAEQ